MIDFYSNKVVTKPWGYEYVIFNNKKKLAITFLKINHDIKPHYIVTHKKKLDL